jgi:hypothetical protein
MSPLTEVISNYSRFGFFSANPFSTDAAIFASLNRTSVRAAFCDKLGGNSTVPRHSRRNTANYRSGPGKVDHVTVKC